MCVQSRRRMEPRDPLILKLEVAGEMLAIKGHEQLLLPVHKKYLHHSLT